MIEKEKPESQYNMLDWWKKAVYENYANFDGRARRSEYWYFSLFNFLIAIAFAILVIVSGGISGGGEEPPFRFYLLMIPFVLFYLIMFVPNLAVSVRRLHDTDKSGWWLLLGIIPIVSYVGSIVLLIFYCTEGTRGPNQYGKDPKQPSDNFFL